MLSEEDKVVIREIVSEELRKVKEEEKQAGIDAYGY